MKRLLSAFIAFIVALTIVIPVSASDYYSVGTITQFECVQVTDKTDYYKLNFTIETVKGTDYYSAYCPALIAPMDVMFVEPQSKFRVRMDEIDSEWYIAEFDLINELNKTVSPPVKMNTFGMPKSIEYNRYAVGDEWMVRVTWGSINTAPFEISAVAVQKLTGETTIDEITNRVSSLSQKLMEEWTRIGTPPDALSETQRIEVVNNQNYLVDTLIYFGFHLYALDDPLTPGNELSFTTIISVNVLPDHWW